GRRLAGLLDPGLPAGRGPAALSLPVAPAAGPGARPAGRGHRLDPPGARSRLFQPQPLRRRVQTHLWPVAGAVPARHENPWASAVVDGRSLKILTARLVAFGSSLFRP